MKFTVVGDVHLADKGPGSRRDTWAQDILDKLTFIGRKAQDEGCSGVIQLGDLFHIKTPSRTSHRLVQRTHEVILSTNLPWYVVPGNHDLSFDRLDSLPEQPLGTLGRMENVFLLHKDRPSVDGLPIYGIEYLQDWRTLPKRLDVFTTWVSEQFSADRPVFLGLHAPIFPDSKTPPYEHIYASQIGTFLQGCPNPLTVGYGHIHDPEGHWSVPTAKNVTVANYGGVSRGSLHAETMKRKPMAYIWDSEDGSLHPFDIPVKPVSEVFDLTEVQIAQEQQSKMTEFLQEVSGDELKSYDSLDTLVKEIGLGDSSSEITADVRRLATELIEFARNLP